MPSRLIDDIQLLVELDTSGQLHSRLNQSFTFDKDLALKTNISVVGLIDDIGPTSEQYLANTIEGVFRSCMRSTPQDWFLPWKSINFFAYNMMQQKSLQESHMNGVVIYKMPATVMNKDGKPTSIYVVSVWIGNPETLTDEGFTKLADFVHCISAVSIPMISENNVSASKVFRYQWNNSIFRNESLRKISTFESMVMFARYWSASSIALNKLTSGYSIDIKSFDTSSYFHLDKVGAIPEVRTLAGDYTKVFQYFTKGCVLLLNLKEGNDWMADMKYKFEPGWAKPMCGDESVNPAKAENLEGLLKIAMDLINEPNTVQSTSRAVLEPTRKMNSLSISKPTFSFGQQQLYSPDYIFQQFHDAYRSSLTTHIESGKSINFRDCHSVALKTAVDRVKYDFTIGAISVEPLLRSEILQLEQEVTALEQAVLKKVREIELSVSVNLLKSAHNSSAIIDSSTETARLELSKIISKCDTKHLEGLGKAFVAQHCSLWKKSAAIIENYQTATKKLLEKRIYLSDQDLQKEHETISKSASAKSLESASTFLEMILVALYHGFKAENICNRTKAEMLHETAFQMSLVAYKKNISDALELTVFTPEALFSIHETASASALKAYNELKSDQTSSLWTKFEKNMKDQIEMEYDLFEELNKFNAFEVEQRGETVVDAAMEAYKTQIGDKTEEQAHEEAKEKAFVTFDNMVKDNIRREVVHMWRQKLTTAIRTHHLKVSTSGLSRGQLLRLKNGVDTQTETESETLEKLTAPQQRLKKTLERLEDKLEKSSASLAVKGQVKKVVDSASLILDKADAAVGEIDLAVRKMELWEKSLNK